MAVAGSGVAPRGSHQPPLTASVAQLIGADGQVAGAGFLVADGLLVTCAHVVRAADGGPGTAVRLVFPRLEGAPRAEGYVLTDAWRAPDAEDVAFLRLAETPPEAQALPLGSAADCHGHRLRSFGFPAQAPAAGHFGFAVAGDLLPPADSTGVLLQLTDANDLAAGFSGGPVLDEVTGLVIGMVSAITAADGHDRGTGIAYATPAQSLMGIGPAPAVREVLPYRGLEPFTTEDARWFHGRDEALRQVLDGLAGQRRVLLLLGPSGSGKSSLIQAGVLPALAAGELPGSDRWLPVVVRPGSDLLTELEHAGLPGARRDGIAAAVDRRLADEPARWRVMLVIDQFEELLTQPAAGQEGDRDRWHAALRRLAEAIDSHAALHVVLVLRDDFYSRLAALAPRLLHAAMPGLLNVPATLHRDDLRSIVTAPAAEAGARFENGLPEQIVDDVLATTPQGAISRRAPVTVLPVLELTLSLLWERRHDHGGRLTHDAYRRVGGISGGLAAWCDTVIARLPPGDRPIAQRILTALVRPANEADQVPAVRRPLPLQDLRELAADPGAADNGQRVDAVIAALTRHRVITTRTGTRRPGQPADSAGPPVAELIHDLLIRDWGTLRDWVNEDHRFHEWLNRVRDQRARWAASGDADDLLTGTTLAEGIDWSAHRRLPHDITAFVDAGRQRQQAAMRRSRRLNAVLATVLALALTAAAVAFAQWRTAAADLARQLSAQSRQLAAQSDSLMAADPSLAGLLAVAAYRTSPTPEAAASLVSAAGLPLRQTVFDSVSGVFAVALSGAGKTMADSSQTAVRLWDATTGRFRATLRGSSAAALAFGPDGHVLAVLGGYPGSTRLWDLTSGAPRTPDIKDTVSGTAPVFSADGRTLAVAGPDGVSIWDAASGRLRTTIPARSASAMALSRDGTVLATSGTDTVRLWDVSTGHPRTTFDTVAAHLAFSPDGSVLATDGVNAVQLWDAATGRLRSTLNTHTTFTEALVFSPTEDILATASTDGTARLWDTTDGSVLSTLRSGIFVRSLAFSPDGGSLAVGDAGGSIRLWSVALPPPEQALETVCRQVHRDLTPQERARYLPGQPEEPVCPADR